MKKGKLILLLALVACMAAGCAYLPLLTMTPEPSANPDTNVVGKRRYRDHLPRAV